MAGDSHAALEALCGPMSSDPAADRAAARAVLVLHAQAAALAWVRQTTGSYPAPPLVAQRLAEAAAQLRADDRDPARVLIEVAAAAVTEYRAASVV